MVVAILANIAAKLFIFFVGERGFAFGENFFTFLIVPGVAGYAAVYVGALVAPVFHKAVAVAYASIWAALCGATSVWIFVGGEYKLLFVTASITVGTAIAALREERELGG